MAGARRHDKAAATKAHLMEAARTVFADRGYQATSVAAITELAETAHGTFYLYFRNREDAFVQVMSATLDDLYRDAFVPLDSLSDRFHVEHNRERIAAFLNDFAAHGRLWRALLEAVLVSPVIESSWLEIRTRFQDRVAVRLQAFRDAGQLGDLDATDVAYALCAMLEWIAFSGVAFESPRPLVQDDPIIDVVATLWTQALRVGQPGGPPAG